MSIVNYVTNGSNILLFCEYNILKVNKRNDVLGPLIEIGWFNLINWFDKKKIIDLVLHIDFKPKWNVKVLIGKPIAILQCTYVLTKINLSKLSGVINSLKKKLKKVCVCPCILGMTILV